MNDQSQIPNPKTTLASRVNHLRPTVPVLSLLLVALLPGCAQFHRLKKEVARLDTQCYITGELMAPGPDVGTNYAIIFQLKPAGGVRIVGVGTVAPEGRAVSFNLPWATNYYFAVFRDASGDLRFNPGEPVWVYGTPSPVVFGQDRRTSPLPVRFSTAPDAMPPELLAALRAARGNRKWHDLPNGDQVALAIGEIAPMSDDRFSSESGRKGLWEPASSLDAQGIGIYFLERYDPRRIPVLFVHGAGGTPRDWSHFATNFDRRRYQLWFYSYPSGLRLDDCALVLDRIVGELNAQYGFASLHVVAHSMGGLVSRRFLLSNVLDHHQPYVRKFVSISSPWKGHEAAALGVKYAPATIPSWIDMEIGSDFTQRLYAQSLSPQIKYSLAFTFGGNRSMFLPESNDGTVSVDSQLKSEAQAEAVRIHGFNETHVSVLRADDTIRWVEAALASP